jgi:hypothetical protein
MFYETVHIRLPKQGKHRPLIQCQGQWATISVYAAPATDWDCYKQFWSKCRMNIRTCNPDGGEISRAIPDRPWGPPRLLWSWYRVSLPEVKRPPCGLDYPPHLAPRLKNRTSTPVGPHGLIWEELYLHIFKITRCYIGTKIFRYYLVKETDVEWFIVYTSYM